MSEERIIPINNDQEPEEKAPVEGEPAKSEEAREIDWEEEANRCKDMYIRAQAEMENVKKRLEREKNDFLKFANENLIKDLLPALDNLERALEHSGPCDTENILEGVRMTYEGLLNVLGKYGVKPIDALGQPFDPNFHQAVAQKEDPEAEANVVLEEMQKGYLLKDRLIRPTMVIVSRKQTEPATEN